MFIKTSEIKCLIICADDFTRTEIQQVEKEFKEKFIVYLFPEEKSQQEIEEIVGLDKKILRKTFMDHVFGYKRIIEEAMKSSGVESYNIVLISKNIEQIKSALDQPIGTVLINKRIVSYDDIGCLPDFQIENINRLKDILNKNTGYFSEVCLTIMDMDKHLVPYSNKGFIFNFNMERNGINFKVFAGGRYYGSKHENHNSHQLSKRINKSKSDTSQNQLFNGLFSPIIKSIDQQDKIDGLSRVPNRPSKEDRLLPIVDSVSNELSIKNISESLICEIEYPSHKELSKEQRFENVADCFEVKGDFTNQHIVLIDDVFTTGATVYECSKMYYNAGAKKVTVVVLAVNQFSYEFNKRKILCQEDGCDGELVLKFNSHNNSAFYGCENYFRQNSCRKTINFYEGWIRMIEENKIRLENNEDEATF